MLERIERALANSIIGKLAEGYFLAALLPGISAIYFGFLDYFNDSIWWIKDYPDLHLRVFIGLMFVELGFRFVQTSKNRHEERTRSNNGTSVGELVRAVSTIVETKIARFRQRLVEATTTREPFKSITQPDTQIEIIFAQAGELLSRLGIDQSRFNASVKETLPDGDWQYLSVRQRNREMRCPNALMSEKSTAQHCLSLGHSVFFPSKSTAAKDGKYIMGNRDQEFGGKGSIYCKPVRVATKEGEDVYIITFVTYGEPICDEFDKEASKSFKFIFDELSRRIELELILWSIKKSRIRYNQRKSKQ